MNVKMEDAGPCRKKLLIEVPAERMDAEYERVVDAFAREARIPGFRPGKAPRQLVAKRFSKDILQEVKDRIIPLGYHEAIEQQKLDPVAILGVENVSFLAGQAATFTVVLDVPPEFKLPSYREIPVTTQKVEIVDEEVDAAKKRLLEQAARWEEVAGRAVQAGDLVSVDYEGVCEGKAIEELAPESPGLGKGKDFTVLASEESFLPGFGQALVGASIGEKRQVPVNFPADFVEKAVAGKACSYFVDIKGIREKKLPDLDAELLGKLGVESEAVLVQRIRDDMRTMKENAEKRRQHNELIRFLLERTTLDVPESVVAQETRDVVYDIVRQQSYQGVSREAIEKQKDEIFEVASRNAAEKVRIRYILHRIAEQEKIEVAEDEVGEEIARMAARYGMPAADFRAELKKKNAVEQVREDIRLNKTLDFLLQHAKIQQQKAGNS